MIRIRASAIGKLVFHDIKKSLPDVIRMVTPENKFFCRMFYFHLQSNY